MRPVPIRFDDRTLNLARYIAGTLNMSLAEFVRTATTAYAVFLLARAPGDIPDTWPDTWPAAWQDLYTAARTVVAADPRP